LPNIFFLCPTKIQWKNRFNSDNGSICLVTIDGTDCPIYEPAPFDRCWYSHKFKGPAVRYELGVCIQTGWIVWKNGPYPAGTWSDLKIARDKVLSKLLLNEKILADGGYRDHGAFCETPTGLNNPDQVMKQKARARHETCNRRMKQFTVLSKTFRNKRDLHIYCFHAVANIVQLDIALGNQLFDVIYFDNYEEEVQEEAEC
jgi:hypothetical protein